MALKTVVYFEATGSQTSFSFGFDYLRPAFIKADLNGTPLTYRDDYTVSANNIVFKEAPQGTLRIYRETSVTPLVDFIAGSVLKATDMTISQVQQLHLIEEKGDSLSENSMITDEDSKQWQGRNLRITNILDPVNDKDVVTKGYIESVKVGFVSAMVAVKDAAVVTLNNTKDAALSEIENLKNSSMLLFNNISDAVSDMLQTATTKASEASASAAKSKQSENKAKTSENNAKVSETNSKASEIAAKASEVAAKAAERSVKASEVVVVACAGEVATNTASALSSKNAAAQSETNAKASEVLAINKANEANVAAGNAQTDAERAEDAAQHAVAGANDWLNMTNKPQVIYYD